MAAEDKKTIISRMKSASETEQMAFDLGWGAAIKWVETQSTPTNTGSDELSDFITKASKAGIGMSQAFELYQLLEPSTVRKNKPVDVKAIYCKKSGCASAVCILQEQCCDMTPSKLANYSVKIKELESVIWNQRQQLEQHNEALRAKNQALDALHYVWCSGGCTSGTHRFNDEKITEEIVSSAEYHVQRLRTWFINAHPIDTVREGNTYRSWKYPPWYWRLALWLTDIAWTKYKRKNK